MNYDVAIIGGSYAGLAAALPLARARRKVIVIDNDLRRNRFAKHSHGFFTQDGTKAADIVKIAKEQLSHYSTVEFKNGTVKRVEQSNDLFHVCIEATSAITAKRLIITTGTTDQLPNIEGITERWGKSIFHCPYCHGYELNQGNIGVIYSSPNSIHLAQMLPDWGKTTLFTNGKNILLDDEKANLENRNVIIDDRVIQQISGDANLVFENNEIAINDGLFVATQTQINQSWITDLGLELESSPMGEIIKTDAMKETSIKGIFAAGDVARFSGSVTFAVADGNFAGVASHRSLIF